MERASFSVSELLLEPLQGSSWFILILGIIFISRKVTLTFNSVFQMGRCAPSTLQHVLALPSPFPALLPALGQRAPLSRCSNS